jgi:hypothetical protein
MKASLKIYLLTTAAVLTALTAYSLPSRVVAECNAGNPVCEQVNRWIWEASLSR